VIEEIRQVCIFASEILGK